MSNISHKMVTAIWLILMGVTLTTWWLAESSSGGEYTIPLVFLLVIFKVRLVLLYFMELQYAPLIWRIFFEVWTVVSAGAIILFYMYS